GELRRLHELQRALGLVEDAVVRRRDPVAAEQVLAEDLAAFELGRLPGGAEDLQPVVLEEVDDALAERAFGADDREVDGVLLRELEEPLEVVRVDVDALGVLGDSGIAGRRVQLGEEGRTRNFPGQGVLASAAADEEDLHQLPAFFLSIQARHLARSSPKFCPLRTPSVPRIACFSCWSLLRVFLSSGSAALIFTTRGSVML